MEVSNEVLASAAAEGDAEAFSSLITRHYDRVFKLAFRLTGSKADAEDLCQDVCSALPAKLRSFRGDAQFATWLYREVVNAANDRRRHHATYAKATEGWGEFEKLRWAEANDTNDALTWLTTAMRALPQELRDTLALIIDDVSHRQAGEILGVSEGTISWRVSEAKKRLREIKESEA